MEIVFGLLALLLVFVFFIVAEKAYSVFSWGFVLFKFWYWFLIPVFITAPQVSYLQAVGLMFILTFFKSVSRTDLVIKDEYIDKKKKKITGFIVYLLPWISLGLGYLFNLIIN